MIDETHDPGLQSWVESANRPGCDFPIQNLPLGVFRNPVNQQARVGVAIGDGILDLREWLDGSDLNGYLALPSTQRRDLRRTLSHVLAKGSSVRELVSRRDCEMLLPARIGDYTDFYASLHHATNVGRLFRPDKALLPNYHHVPIGYHGRVSSIVVSGTSIRRPNGQLAEGIFGPTREFDYELEIGAFLGPGNRMGEPIPVNRAEEHIGGICVVNDWSARDIQRWEYQPLGPFLGKNFATSISPWMVTLEALAPFRTRSPQREVPVLGYLESPCENAFEVTLEVRLMSGKMSRPELISKGFFQHLYWTLDQMVAHHTSNGCPLRPGDLIASGTISGPEKMNAGCLLELTQGGRAPLTLSSGAQRSFLEDGDEVIMSGFCWRDGYKRIGLGECTGQVVSAR